jgi:hypothetical protein
LTPRHRVQPGPALLHAFTVTAGLVAVQGLNGQSLTIPAPGTWPGLAALPAALLDALQPTDTAMTPGTRITGDVSPDARAGGVALVNAQLLRGGPSLERLTCLARLCDPASLNQTTVAQLIGVSRHTANGVLCEWRARE